MSERFGDSTRAVKAVDSEPVAAARSAVYRCRRRHFTLSAEEGTEPHVYGRYSNPSWTQLERALAQLEGATHALVFGSGMAAVTAVLRVLTVPGTVLVIPRRRVLPGQAVGAGKPCAVGGVGSGGGCGAAVCGSG